MQNKTNLRTLASVLAFVFLLAAIPRPPLDTYFDTNQFVHSGATAPIPNRAKIIFFFFHRVCQRTLD